MTRKHFSCQKVFHSYVILWFLYTATQFTVFNKNIHLSGRWMIYSFYQVKIIRKLSSQILLLLSAPNSPLFKAHVEFRLFPSHLLWSTLDKSSWLPLAKIYPLLFYQKTTFALCGHSSCASSQETHAWAFHLGQCEKGNFEKGTKQRKNSWNNTMQYCYQWTVAGQLLISKSISLTETFFRSFHTLDRQSKVLAERQVTPIKI